MSSRREVAREAGVSETTVTNILNGLKPATKEVEARVLAAAKKLNYTPNVIAQGLRTKNSRQIGVFISEIGNPYFVEILHGIETEAARQHYSTTIILLKDNIESKYKDIVGRRFAGIINISNVPYTTVLMDELYNSGVALLNFDAAHGSIVWHDMAPSMRTMIQTAYGIGHTKAGYLLGYPDEATALLDPRVLAYRDECARLGYEEHDNMLIYGDFPRLSSSECGYIGVKQLFAQGDPGITVLFCINDMTALGALCALNELHIRVPEDMSIVGCDNIGISRYFTPPLTTIETHCFTRGEEMVKALVRKIDGGENENILLPCEDVFRDSLVPPKKMRG